MIDIKNIFFAYGEKKIFENFSLKIENGERICLQASSGKGKTTLLKLILGLEKPQKGEIVLDKNCRFSCAFQEDRLLMHHTAKQNLTLFANEKSSKEMLENLGLGTEADKYPAQLSGGMARRLAIARALLIDADVYIFDEPFNGLDDETKKKTANLINEICENKTVIMISHDISEAQLLNAKVIDIFKRWQTI